MTPQDKIREMQVRVAELLKKELQHRGLEELEALEDAEITATDMAVLMDQVPCDDYPIRALMKLGQYLDMTFTFNLGETRPYVAVAVKPSMSFQVRLTGMAMMEQSRSIEADTEEEALAKAKSDYGSYSWSYEGMDDDTVEAEIAP